VKNIAQFTFAGTFETNAVTAAVALFLPAALIDILVFPLSRVAGAWLGFNIVPPLVLGALAVGPDVLARD